MASESNTTTDHKTIKQWAEARGGKPATVKSTEKNGEAGVLRIDFPGYSGAGSLEEISWDEFFAKFDEKNLAFLYQEHTSSGEESRFFKLVSRDIAEHKSASTSHKSSTTAHKSETQAHKAGDKDDKAADKAHSVPGHKGDEKSSKAEEKAHKAEAKAHKSHK